MEITKGEIAKFINTFVNYTAYVCAILYSYGHNKKNLPRLLNIIICLSYTLNILYIFKYYCMHIL